jgi:hypothetical protein
MRVNRIRLALIVFVGCLLHMPTDGVSASTGAYSAGMRVGDSMTRTRVSTSPRSNFVSLSDVDLDRKWRENQQLARKMIALTHQVNWLDSVVTQAQLQRIDGAATMRWE